MIAISDDFAITNPRLVPPHAFSLRARSRRLIHQFVNDLLASFSRTIGLYRGRITIRIEARKTALLTHGSFSLSSEANGQRLELWLAPQRCVDSMSGSVQHLSAELRLNGSVQRGCASFGGARSR